MSGYSTVRSALAVLALACGIGSAQAATYSVNTLADPGDGTCDDIECTLREAITASNANPGADIIEFTITGTISLTSVLPEISDQLAINGPGAEQMTVRRDMGGDYRIFKINADGVTFSGLTISEGNAGEGLLGGGIYNACACIVSISDSILGGNVADSGGAVYNAAGATLSVTNTTLSDNRAVMGGGIHNEGAAYVTQSSFSGNVADEEGGGIFNGRGSLRVVNSTFSGNVATLDGGAIATRGGSTLVMHSTISGNTAGTGGGFFGGSLAIVGSSIFVGNMAYGGSVSEDLFSCVPIFFPSIPCVLSSGFNVIGSTSGIPLATTDLDRVTPADLKLGPLQDNGGPTHTMALGPGSVAIDRAIADDLTTDQRGWARRFDSPSLPNTEGGDGTDAGAFEVQSPSTVRPSVTLLEPPSNVQYSDLLTISATTQSDGLPATGTVDFRIDDQLLASAAVDPSSGVAGHAQRVGFKAGTYALKAVFRSDNPLILDSEDTATLNISKENVVFTPRPANPRSWPAPLAGTSATTSSFCFDMEEADGRLGDPLLLNSATVDVSVSGGGGGASTVTPTSVDFSGSWPRTACFALSLNETPVNRYEVRLVLVGDHYTGSTTTTLDVFPLAGTVTTLDHPPDTQYTDLVSLRSTTVASSGSPAGSVQFLVDGVLVGVANVDVNGIAAVTVPVHAAAGSRPVRADFTSSNVQMLGSLTTGTLTVLREDATVTPQPGNPASFVALPEGTAMGMTQPFCFRVTEASDGSPGGLGLLDSATVHVGVAGGGSGAATITPLGITVTGSGAMKLGCFTLRLQNTPVNVYEITFTLAGDYFAGSATSTFTVGAPTTTTLTPPATTQYSDVVTLTATVAGSVSPQGTVAFYAGNAPGTLVGTAAVGAGGVATASVRIELLPGAYGVRAVFTSTAAFVLSSEGTGILVVTREDVVGTPLSGNPVSMLVSLPGGTASGITAPLCFAVSEPSDGSAGNSALIDSATVGIAAATPGASAITAGPLTFSGGGVGSTRQICFPLTLNNVPIGTYQVTLLIGGGASYYAGSDTITLTIRDWSADVRVTLGADTLNPKPGDVVTYTVTIRNFGPETAVNTVVNDMLSNLATFVSARANVGTFRTPPIGQSGNVTWHVGDVASDRQEGAQIQVTVVVRGRPTITNSVSVSSTTADPDLTNNSASLTMVIGSPKQ